MNYLFFIVFIIISPFVEAQKNEGLDQLNFYSLQQLNEYCGDSIWNYQIVLKKNDLILKDTVLVELITFQCFQNGFIRKTINFKENDLVELDSVIFNVNQFYNNIDISKYVYFSTEYLDGFVEPLSHKTHYYKNHGNVIYKTEEFYTDGRRRIIEKIIDSKRYSETLITLYEKDGTIISVLKKVQRLQKQSR